MFLIILYTLLLLSHQPQTNFYFYIQYIDEDDDGMIRNCLMHLKISARAFLFSFLPPSSFFFLLEKFWFSCLFFSLFLQTLSIACNNCKQKQIIFIIVQIINTYIQLKREWQQSSRTKRMNEWMVCVKTYCLRFFWLQTNFLLIFIHILTPKGLNAFTSHSQKNKYIYQHIEKCIKSLWSAFVIFLFVYLAFIRLMIMMMILLMLSTQIFFKD